MSEFESIVRPFQDRSVTPGQTYFMPGQIGVPNVILKIGRGSGSGKTLNGSVSVSQSFYCKAYEVESKTPPSGGGG